MTYLGFQFGKVWKSLRLKLENGYAKLLLMNNKTYLSGHGRQSYLRNLYVKDFRQVIRFPYVYLFLTKSIYALVYFARR